MRRESVCRNTSRIVAGDGRVMFEGSDRMASVMWGRMLKASGVLTKGGVMASPAVHKERRALVREGNRVPRYVTLDEFRKAWVGYFGPPVLPSEHKFLDVGIKDFWEDYLTGAPQTVRGYLSRCEV